MRPSIFVARRIAEQTLTTSTMNVMNVDVELSELLDHVLDYLSTHLPPQVYPIVETLLAQTYTLLTSLVSLTRTLLSHSPLQWDAQQILPPLITLLVAYIALVSLYRTTAWVVRTAFAFAKWGFILSALGAAAGYFLANANAGGVGNGVGMFGAGHLPALGGMLLGLFSPDQQRNHRTRPTRRTGSKTYRDKKVGKEQPKAWQAWRKHREHADEQSVLGGVQETISEVLRTASECGQFAWQIWEDISGELGKGGQDGKGSKKTEDGKRSKEKTSRVR